MHDFIQVYEQRCYGRPHGGFWSWCWWNVRVMSSLPCCLPVLSSRTESMNSQHNELWNFCSRCSDARFPTINSWNPTLSWLCQKIKTVQIFSSEDANILWACLVTAHNSSKYWRSPIIFFLNKVKRNSDFKNFFVGKLAQFPLYLSTH